METIESKLKRLFIYDIIGGAADKTKVLKVGDEIMSVNTNDCTRMSRIEAWNFMKKLSDGSATLVVRQKIPQDSIKEQPPAKQQAQQQPQQKKEILNSSETSPSSAGDANTVANPASGAKREEGTTKVDRTVEETKHI